MKFAIFDIDGTIFRSSLVIELCLALVRKKVFPKKALDEIQFEHTAWLNRQGSYEAYINKVVKIYIKHIEGKSFSKVKKVAKQVISAQKDMTYRFTRGLITKFKKQGYVLVAISGSPSYIVEEYAKVVGFDECYGTELWVEKGKFTGRVKNLDPAFKKALVVKKLLNKYNNSDLKNSVAVGDTEGDTAMLKLVGRAIAFNPNMHLAKIARKNNWEVVVERKDVIYSFVSGGFLLLKE
ncbi:MAG: HAD family phosphatase [Candidatus Doudnabacteria bacterium]|nr:HAD family phosphatase [Candidatus Doudnabacteria bacterium]